MGIAIDEKYTWQVGPDQRQLVIVVLCRDARSPVAVLGDR